MVDNSQSRVYAHRIIVTLRTNIMRVQIEHFVFYAELPQSTVSNTSVIQFLNRPFIRNFSTHSNQQC